MRGNNRWLWILTFSNVAIIFLLIFVIRAILSAIGAFAAYVSAWPLVALVLLGGVLSLVGVVVARRADSSTPRRIGCVVNGSILAFHSICIVVGLAASVLIPRERFLIHEGYMGDVYVVHSVAGGEPERRTFWGVTYRIPQDGILCTLAPMNRGITRSAYYYERGDGTVERIPNFWPTTIHRTPTNLANDKDLGVFFPHSGNLEFLMGPGGKAGSSAKCSAEYEEFYVGTQAYLLSNHREKDLGSYLREHSVCGGPTN